MDLIADVFVNKFAEIEFQYVQRYMCIPDACPCNTRVNPANFGDRKLELGGLELFEGKADMFYEDCYKNLV